MAPDSVCCVFLETLTLTLDYCWNTIKDIGYRMLVTTGFNVHQCAHEENLPPTDLYCITTLSLNQL